MSIKRLHPDSDIVCDIDSHSDLRDYIERVDLSDIYVWRMIDSVLEYDLFSVIRLEKCFNP